MASKRKSAAKASKWRPPDARPLILVGPKAGPVDDFELLLGVGDDLWADDAQFEAWLAALYRWRKEDRQTSRKP
jgi:hypothetical protein